jgi:hypothetical protein
MPLTFPDPPSNARDVAVAAIDLLPQAEWASLGAGRRDKLELTPAATHQFFVMDLKDLLAGRGISSAKPAGWRMLLLDGDRPVATVEMAGASGRTAELLGIDVGPFASEALEGIEKAEDSAAAGDGDYEVRLLEIPDVYATSWWFHRPGHDRFLPFSFTPPPLESGTVYAPTRFFALLQEVAQQRAKRPDPEHAAKSKLRRLRVLPHLKSASARPRDLPKSIPSAATMRAHKRSEKRIARRASMKKAAKK